MTAQNDQYDSGQNLGPTPDQPMIRERRGRRRRNPLSFAVENSGTTKNALLTGVGAMKSGASNFLYFLERAAEILVHVYWGALAVFVIEIVLSIMNINIWYLDWWGGLGFKDSEFLHHGFMTVAAFTWWLASSAKVSINSFLKRWELAQKSLQGFNSGDPLGFNILNTGWRSLGGMAIWIVWSITYFTLSLIAMYIVVSILAMFRF